MQPKVWRHLQFCIFNNFAVINTHFAYLDECIVYVCYWFKVTCTAAHSSVTHRSAVQFNRLGHQGGLVHQALSSVIGPIIRLSTMDQTDQI